MPDELFTARIVQNKTFSLKRDLITFQSDTFDIKNPRTSEVNPWFLISGMWDVTLLQVYSHQQTVEEKDEFLAGLETYLRDPGDVVLLVSCCQAARDCCSRIQTTLLSNQVSNTINFLLVSQTLTRKWSQNIKFTSERSWVNHSCYWDSHSQSSSWSASLVLLMICAELFTAASSDLLDLFVY